MLENIFISLALMCVFEGIFPFLSPGYYKSFISCVLQLDDKIIRIFGFIIMFVGVLSIILVGHA